MKKIIMTTLLTMPLAVSAADETPMPTNLRGIHIVPMQKLSIPSEMKQKVIEGYKQQKEKGYQYTDKPVTKYLLNIDSTADYQIKFKSQKDYGVYDTRIKKSYKDIQLSFGFNGIPMPEQDVIGYAAIGSFSKEKGKEGWTGIREFFKNPELGRCSYSFMGILAVQLGKETTEYLVNKKPTNKVIEGNPESGFVYSLTWYTDNSMSTLECAHKVLDERKMVKLVSLANAIDHSNHSEQKKQKQNNL